MGTTVDLGKELHKKRGEMDAFIKANSESIEGKPQFHWNAVKSNDDKSASEVGITEFNQRNEELAKLQDEYSQARDLEDAAKKNSDAMKAMEEVVNRRNFSGSQNPALEMESEQAIKRAIKSLGEMFMESAEFKANADKSPDMLKQWAAEIPQGSMAIKANSFTTASGGSGVVPYPPQGRFVDYAARRLVMRNLLSVQDTTASGQAYQTVQFIRENVQTLNADIVAEGGLKPLSELGDERVTLTLEAIAHRIKVPNQALIFIPGVQDRIDRKGTFGVQLAEENNMLNYNGSAGWKGLMVQSGVQSDALGSSDQFSGFHRGMTLVETGGSGGAGSQATVSGFVIHPNDWHEIITIKDLQNRFIYGDPSQQTPDVRLWGVPGVKTVAATEGTVLMGDFAMYAVWWVAGGIRMIVGYENDDISRNQQTIVVEEYGALEIDRPAAFVKQTGY